MPVPAAAWFGLALGVSVFFGGLALLKSALASFEPAVGPLLRRALARPVFGVAAGFLATALVQSSSTVNAVAVGLVAAGMLELPHAFAIVLGANVGTTLTAQLVSFGTREAGLALVGAGLLAQVLPSPVSRRIGSALGATGALFFGLWAIGTATGRLAEAGVVARLFAGVEAGDERALLFGVLLTGVVQSSSAVSSLLTALADAGVVGVRTAIAGVLGSNVGTVTTTLLVGLAAGDAAARRTAFADLIFNVAGVLFIWPFLGPFVAGMAMTSDDPGRQVANAHTAFNLLGVLLFLPFFGPFCRLLTRGLAKHRGPS